MLYYLRIHFFPLKVIFRLSQERYCTQDPRKNLEMWVPDVEESIFAKHAVFTFSRGRTIPGLRWPGKTSFYGAWEAPESKTLGPSQLKFSLAPFIALFSAKAPPPALQFCLLILLPYYYLLCFCYLKHAISFVPVYLYFLKPNAKAASWFLNFSFSFISLYRINF